MINMSEEKRLYSRAYVLAILTVIFSSLEGGFSVYYGYGTNSLTLFGNGVASFIEVISGFGILGMTMKIRSRSKENPNNFERTALRITGTGLYVLAGSLVAVGIMNIVNRQHPSTTISGIIIAIVTIIVIGLLVLAKLRVGKKLHSKALIADAKCTRICVYMSTMVFVSSIVYELTKFVYADSIGAIGLAYFAYSEAKECFDF
jgi:divalent metal cation (Fe/Co/Zn/Cd) transporter